MYVFMMHISMIIYPDAFAYDAHMYTCMLHVSVILNPWPWYSIYDVFIYDPWFQCMYEWCMYPWCIYLWSLILMNACMMHLCMMCISMILVPWTWGLYLWCSKFVTNGGTDKPILVVGYLQLDRGDWIIRMLGCLKHRTKEEKLIIYRWVRTRGEIVGQGFQDYFL